jgi:Methyltransferase domain
MAIADKIYSMVNKTIGKLGLWRNALLRGGKRRQSLTEAIAPFAGSILDVSSEERGRTAMHRAFYENSGSIVHKWRHYLDIYNRYLERYRGQSVRFLEIGVSKGGSLAMWRRYFGPEAKIFGIDIDPICAQLDGINAEVRIGSQADRAFLENVIAEMGGVDVVIDDGSHIASDQRASFDTIFPLLDADGVYICEDTHTAYWAECGGGYRNKSSFLEMAKKIADDLNGDFHSHALSIKDANRILKAVHFYNSMVVIEKSPQPRPVWLAVG